MNNVLPRFAPPVRHGTGSAAVAPTHASRLLEVAIALPDQDAEYFNLAVPALPAFEETASAFARGTVFSTPDGPCAVEDLVPGQFLIDDTGTPEQVLWIGSTSYIPGTVPPESGLRHLIRVTSDGLDDTAPQPDLLAGPGARFEVRHPRLDRLLGDGAVLAPMVEYVDGDRFIAVTPHSPVQLYHVGLRQHSLLKIGGVRVESYHPGKVLDEVSRMGLRKLFLSLFPGFESLSAFGPLRFTRTSREALDSLLDR